MIKAENMQGVCAVSPFLVAILVCGIGFVLYLLAAGFAVYYKGLCRYVATDRNYDPARGDLPLKATSSEYRHRAQEGNRWWNTNAQVQRCEIRACDDTVLRGGFLRGKDDSDIAVLVVHGHACCAGEMGFISRMYHEMGCHVLAIDQRAHGKSEGIHMTMGLWERFDIVEWAQYLAKRCPSCKLVLHGCSMGAATVLYASALALPREVCCCIADCGYTSPGEAFLQELKVKYPFLKPRRWVLAVTNAICRSVIWFDMWRVDVRAAVKQSALPTLFIHGTGDRAVPHAMGEELYALHRGPKELQLFAGAAHAVSYFADPARYTSCCEQFIEKYKDA